MLWFHRLRNAVDYPLRQLVHWRRGGLRFRPEPKDDLWAHLPPDQASDAASREARLIDRYHLAAWREASTRHHWRLNLFYLELLERALTAAAATLPSPLTAVDIGPSHWFYVQGLHALLRWFQATAPRPLQLTAYEADPWRVYGDLRSRYDHALAHAAGLDGVAYRPTAFEPPDAGADLVLLLFPFVFPRDHLRWGLPQRLFDPLTLLRAAWSTVRPGGTLLIVNQGAAEHACQRERLAACDIPLTAALAHESPLFQHKLVRHALVARRES
ncbi:MAG: hypothetical protein IT204_07100 [Fimbriimonadaceae bacterium]|nr:hypothetical protein [Fimbriimonadaceae bacterium]